jgi:tripartite-type tricarboxylate transporter receptor subunit TctC
MSPLVRLAALAIAGLGWHLGAIAAEPYPTKPIRVIVTFPPSGQTDVVARAIQPYLESRLGRPVVVDNRPGAGGTIGVDAVAKAAPDGYVIGVGPMGALTVSMSLQDKMPYDMLKDLVPVGMLTTTPFVLAAPLSSQFKSLSEVIALAKTKPGSLSIGHGGNGTAMHLTGPFLKLNEAVVGALKDPGVANPLNLIRVMPVEGNEMHEQTSFHHGIVGHVRGPRMHGADDDMTSV